MPLNTAIDESLISEFNFYREFHMWELAQKILSTLMSLHPNEGRIEVMKQEFARQQAKLLSIPPPE